MLLGLALVVLATAWMSLAITGPERTWLWGDEGTYTAMAASLVRDGDLLFSASDLDWVLERQPERPVTTILQQTGGEVAYSKPILYPLLAAPLYLVLGESGLVATNVLALVGALVLLIWYLRPAADATALAWTLLSFFAGTVLLAYLGWKMSDLALFSLTLAGLVLALGGREHAFYSGGRLPFAGLSAAVLGGALLGAASSMRFTSAALAAAAALALVLDRRPRRGLLVGFAAGVAFLALAGASHLAIGTSNPYKAVRSSFNGDTGYPAGPEAELASRRFVHTPATQSATWRPPWQPRTVLYSSLYFLVGRHTGLLVYFPAALLLLAHLLRRPDRVALTLLAGAAAVVGFYLLWMPDNYFGGSTFVGNRYLLGALPVLLVTLTRMPGKRTLALIWLLAAVVWGSALSSRLAVADLGSSSQAHAHAGIFRWLPFESTARRIDGLAERYWADDYLRFLDPFARVGRWGFTLDSERPATEVLVATAWTGTPLRFVVSPHSDAVVLEVSDWRGHDRFRLPLAAPAASGLVEAPVSPPWRRHPFWWKPGRLYNARVLRFSLAAADAGPATATVRYAGKGRVLAPLEAELLRLAPDPGVVAEAGATTPLTVAIRNTGRRPWKAEGLFPVRITYRFPTQPGAPGGRPRPVPIDRNVRSGDSLIARLPVTWPDDPGSYPLIIELLREPAGRLGELGRLTLTQVDVEVRPLSPDSREP